MREPQADSHFAYPREHDFSNPTEMNATQERLFNEWRDLHQHALRTMRMEDAHASGIAYRRFHQAYLDEPANVVPPPSQRSDDPIMDGAA